MNWTHVHLALNHVPVLGSIFVALLLIAGFVKKSEELKRMSLWWFVVLTLLAIPIKFTGDFAFEANEQSDWMETPMATAHEQSADQATTGVFLLGIAAGVGLFLGRKGRA
ncbi:MAG: putative membrane protein, partial [Limisphaerales bacterium]